jgi:HAD superfamily hydrolase (TIGR01549 family)
VDLDDTLVVDDAVVVEALRAVCAAAAGEDGEGLFRTVWGLAWEEWSHGETGELERRAGVGALEGLVSDLEGCHPRFARLGRAVADYRARVWGLAAAAWGLPRERGVELASAFRHLRRSRYSLTPHTREFLAALAPARLAVVTNGPADLQREKLVRTGLLSSFDVVIVSTELGAAKPEPEIFHAALEALGVPASKAVMVGDDPVLDLDGAAACELRTALVGSGGEGGSARPPDYTAPDLGGLAAALAHCVQSPR